MKEQHKMKELIQKYKSLTKEVNEIEGTLGEKFIPIVRILNMDESSDVYISEGEIIEIRNIEIRDEDVLVLWKTDLDDTGYNAIPFSILFSDNPEISAANFYKNREKEGRENRLKRKKMIFESLKDEIHELEEKLKENV